MMSTTSWVMVGLGVCAWLLVMVTNAMERRRLAFTPAPNDAGPQGDDVPCSFALVRVAVLAVVTVVTLLWAVPALAQCTVECRDVPEPATSFHQVFLPTVETGARGEGRGARAVEDGPIVGPGPCSSETPWGCFAHQVWLPAVMNG